MLRGRILVGEAEPYRTRRVVQPPPDPDEIDVWMLMPFSEEVKECLACPDRGPCMSQLAEGGQFFRPLCEVTANPSGRDDSPRGRVITALREGGPQTMTQVAARVGLSVNTVRPYMYGLRGKGVVIGEGQGRMTEKVWRLVGEKGV